MWQTPGQNGFHIPVDISVTQKGPHGDLETWRASQPVSQMAVKMQILSLKELAVISYASFAGRRGESETAPVSALCSLTLKPFSEPEPALYRSGLSLDLCL